MTYSLVHISTDADSEIACVVREDDGAYQPLSDTDILIELRNMDKQSYALLMALAHKLVESARIDHLTA
jgi:hypothetical protein